MEKQNIFVEILKLLLEFFSKSTPTELPNPPQPEVKAPEAPEKKGPEAKFILTRKRFQADGIFSELTDQGGNVWAETLEHSYNNLPKLPNGLWRCQRGPHRLHGMTSDFETFEVMDVPGHDNILFHWGNYNKDSEGCILLGDKFVELPGDDMVTNSKVTFAKFMKALEGVNEFYLLIK